LSYLIFISEFHSRCCVVDDLQLLVDIADSDSSVEEFEDASETFTVEDDIFVDVETKRIQPLSMSPSAICVHSTHIQYIHG
jgi:hypothetical protein